MVGVILRRMENEGDKTEEKMMFLVVWLRVENMRDFGEVHKFSPLPPHTTSPNWIENGSEKWAKIFGQNSPHFLFTFFFLPQPGRKYGLPTLCFFSFGFN